MLTMRQNVATVVQHIGVRRVPVSLAHTYLPNTGNTTLILLNVDFRAENRSDPYPEGLDSLCSFSSKVNHVHITTGKENK